MEMEAVRAGWKFTTMEHGEPFVMISGAEKMHKSYAGRLGVATSYQHLGNPISVQALEKLCWITCVALEVKGTSVNVTTQDGCLTTVIIVKMPVPFVQVNTLFLSQEYTAHTPRKLHTSPSSI